MFLEYYNSCGERVREPFSVFRGTVHQMQSYTFQLVAKPEYDYAIITCQRLPLVTVDDSGPLLTLSAYKGIRDGKKGT